MSDHPTFAEVLLSAVNAFDYAKFDTPQMDARLLLCHAADISHTKLISSMHDAVSENVQQRFSEFVARRIAFEPVHRIIGMREFYGRDFVLGSEALIPRPDTETLIDTVLSKFEDRSAEMRILDLGTGSGVIAVTLACEFPNASVVAVDVSEDAVANCIENGEQLGVGGRLQVLHSDLFEKVSGKFDLIVSNPPYIPTADLEGLAPEVRLHDPLRALDGGADGMDFYRRIFARAKEFLKPDGMLALEFGFGQSDEISELAVANTFRDVSLHKDLGGIARVLIARC